MHSVFFLVLKPLSKHYISWVTFLEFSGWTWFFYRWTLARLINPGATHIVITSFACTYTQSHWGSHYTKKKKNKTKQKKHTNIHLDKFINFRFILPQRSGRIIVVFTFVFSVEIAWHFSHISAAHFVQNLIILTELFAAFGALCDSSSWPSRVWCM